MILIYLRARSEHSLVGLDDNSMVLLGGRIDGIYQTSIWQIKEDVWSKIGKLTQVKILIILSII